MRSTIASDRMGALNALKRLGQSFWQDNGETWKHEVAILLLLVTNESYIVSLKNSYRTMAL